MRSAEYWAARAEATEAALHRQSKQTTREVQAAYDKALADIREDMQRIFGKVRRDGRLTAKEARALLNVRESDQMLDLLRERIRKIKDKDIRKELLARINAPTYREQLSRLQALREAIDIEFRRMGEIQLETTRGRLIDTMTEAYQRSIYNMQRGTGLGFSFTLIPRRALQKALEHKWESKNFSERVWDNTAYTAEKAKEIITAGIGSGRTVRRMAQELEEATGGAKLAAERLIRTENNYFQNQGTLEGYKEAGITHYRYLATLDAITCAVCGALDRKVFLVTDAVVGENYPPIHWNDRCTTAPQIAGKELSAMKRRARDPATGRTYLVPADTTWEEWRRKHLPVLASGEKSDIMQDINLRPIPITDKAIAAVPLVDVPSLTGKQARRLRERSQELLRYMREDTPGREGIAYYSADLQQELYKAKGGQGQVSAKTPDGSGLWCIHNHPSGNTFTHTDVGKLIRNPGLQGIVAVGNNGTVYILEKGIKYSPKAAAEGFIRLRKTLDQPGMSPQQYLAAIITHMQNPDNGFVYRKGAANG